MSFYKDCRHRGGITKQIKSKRICLHIHVLLCVLREHSKPLEEVHASEWRRYMQAKLFWLKMSISQLTGPELWISCQSTLYPIQSQVNMLSNVGILMLELLQDRRKSWPSTFEPTQKNCELCGALLDLPKIKSGSDGEAFLLTHQHPFRVVKIVVKFCGSSQCKAMHRVWLLGDGKVIAGVLQYIVYIAYSTYRF